MKNINLLRKSLLTSAASLALVACTSSLDAQIYASSADQNLGTFANGNPIPASFFRAQKFNAIGEPQRSDVDTQVNGNPNSVNFSSLGFGGTLTLTMEAPFTQCEGPDVTVWETSYSTPSCNTWKEFAKVEVSQDGCNWYTVVESACQDFSFDLPNEMPWALYIRLTDVSNENHFSGSADGWDLDGVEAFCAANVELLPQGSAFGADGYENFLQGTLKNGGNISPSRSNPSSALGLPQNNNSINFLALGFNKPNSNQTEGQITLTFTYTVFDQPGTHDIEVFETTFGDAPNRPCSSYPEKAFFEGSSDGATFYTLTTVDEPGALGDGILCRDGKLDIGNIPSGTLRYLRITDMSDITSSRFPNNADAYDVDGVVVYPCPTSSGKLDLVDRNDIPDEDGGFSFGIYPNPANDFVNITIETFANEDFQIRLSDIAGRTLINESVNSGNNTELVQQLNINELPTGVYLITVESKTSKMTQKIIKK